MNMKQISPLEKRVTLADQVYERIRELLGAGDFGKETIISASGLAQELQISRTPVREALLQLANEGLLEALSGRGFRIRYYSDREIQEYFEARRIIEVFVIRHLAKKIKKSDLRELKKHLRSMVKNSKKGLRIDFLEDDKLFHQELLNLHGNSFLISVYDKIRMMLSTHGQMALASPKRMEEVINEHKLILKALENNDSREAVKAVKGHLELTAAKLLEQTAK